MEHSISCGHQDKMPEIIGDPIFPSEIAVPELGYSGATIYAEFQPTYSGALFMSGSKLYIRGAARAELVGST